LFFTKRLAATAPRPRPNMPAIMMYSDDSIGILDRYILPTGTRKTH
jgi:hypothetical protein